MLLISLIKTSQNKVFKGTALLSRVLFNMAGLYILYYLESLNCSFSSVHHMRKQYHQLLNCSEQKPQSHLGLSFMLHIQSIRKYCKLNLKIIYQSRPILFPLLHLSLPNHLPSLSHTEEPLYKLPPSIFSIGTYLKGLPMATPGTS